MGTIRSAPRSVKANEEVRPLSDPWHAVERLLRESLGRSLDALNISRKADVDRLSGQIFDLERKLRDTQHALKREVTSLARELGASDAEIARLHAETVRLRPMAMLSDMVPALAHDLSTPIGNANLVSSSLRQRVANFRATMESGELRKSDLADFLDDLDSGIEILCSAGNRAAEISGALKHVAIDYASMRRREFALTELVSDVLTTLHPSLRKADVLIETRIPETLRMRSYPGPLGQVLTNLIQNAIRHAFAPDMRGVITLEARPVGDGHMQLRVIDNGVGMNDSVQKKLFTPFFTTQPDAGGSGVGLNYARQLVENPLGGTLRLASQPGEGTSITLTLPCVAAEQPTQPPQP